MISFRLLLVIIIIGAIIAGFAYLSRDLPAPSQQINKAITINNGQEPSASVAK